MPKKLLYVLAETNKEGNKKLDEFIADLHARGFIGTMAKSIPGHVLLTTFPSSDVESVIARVNKAATENSKFDIEYQNIGIGDKTLFLIPSFNSALAKLHDEVALSDEVNWHPQTPVMISEPKDVLKAAGVLPQLLTEFASFSSDGKFKVTIDSISIYEFNPTYLIEKARLN